MSEKQSALVEVNPGGGSENPEPQTGVQSFVFVVSGSLTVTVEGQTQTLEEGGFAYLPAGATWSAHNNGVEVATFHWIRKRYEALAGVGLGLLPLFEAGSLPHLIAGLVGGHVDPNKLQEMPALFQRTAISLFIAAAVLALLSIPIKRMMRDSSAGAH